VKETALSRSIRKALTSLGYWVERTPASKLETASGSYVHGPSKGTPDLLIVAPLWAYGWIEVKSPKGKLSEVQKQWHARAARAGVRVAVVRSVKEALEVVALWRADRRAA
jgi:hypothetical protein